MSKPSKGRRGGEQFIKITFFFLVKECKNYNLFKANPWKSWIFSQIKSVLSIETMLNRRAAQFAIERSGRELQACLAARVMAVCLFDISFSSFFLVSCRFSVLR